MRRQLLKLMNQLSSEQQAEYKSVYDNKENYIDRSTGLHRKILHLSGDSTTEEIRKALAEAYGCEPEDLPEINFTKSVSGIKEHKAEVKTVIEEYETYLKSNNSTSGKQDELLDVGRFIVAANPSLKIVVPVIEQAYPDFRITHGDEIIGLEHTRLIDESMIVIFKDLKKIIQQAEDQLQPEFQTSQKNINVFFRYDVPVSAECNFSNARLSINDKKNLSAELAEYLKTVLLGSLVEKPAFVDKVVISDNKDSRLNIILAEDYMTSHLFIELLLECMAKKEIKANNYRSAMGGNQLLLLVIVDDINSFSGFDLAATKLPKMSHSNFDKIIVFEKFGRKIHQLN
jgi:hypothetical protein